MKKAILVIVLIMMVATTAADAAPKYFGKFNVGRGMIQLGDETFYMSRRSDLYQACIYNGEISCVSSDGRTFMFPVQSEKRVGECELEAGSKTRLPKSFKIMVMN